MITRGFTALLFLLLGVLLISFGTFLGIVTEVSFSSVIVCSCGFYFCYETYAAI